jgi:hypothetical protein
MGKWPGGEDAARGEDAAQGGENAAPDGGEGSRAADAR